MTYNPAIQPQDLDDGTEVPTGREFNGEPTFRKVIALGSLPNATTGTVAHGITSLTAVVSVLGSADDATDQLPLPFVDAQAIGSGISIEVDDTNINIDAGSVNRSTWTGRLVIEYTTS